MAPEKRKLDDFVYTISDTEELAVDETRMEWSPPPKKSKKSKKGKGVVEHGEETREHDNFNSDFEFQLEDAGYTEGDFEGWGFDGAKRSEVERKVIDIDELIRKRREKSKAKGKKAEKKIEDLSAQDEADTEIDLNDGNDEVLADDGFGMGAGSDAEESSDANGDTSDADFERSGEEEDDAKDAHGDLSDTESVAMHSADHDATGLDSDSEQDDVEEAAKRRAFFAPDDNTKPSHKVARSFLGFKLSRPILRGLAHVGFSNPTPIQAKAIPIGLEGRDVVGGAVTGSGKTAAFLVPILDRLVYRPNKNSTTRVVIMTPTRELAVQCHAMAVKLASHTDIKICLVVGGLSMKVQQADLRLRPDVVIATPGRFIDHMRNSASFEYDKVEILVLDEADRMLEDGFADELDEVLKTLPTSRQTMLFSATMNSTVDRLIRVGMNKPVSIMVDSQNKTVQKLEQKFVRLRPGREDKRMGYLVHLCKTRHTERVIVFFRQKKEAHRARIVFALLGMSCAELHGSMNQSQRMANVESFRDGQKPFLFATDLASRGLDIKGIDTVINYEAPQSVETYVHRVGRTARAGRSGVAITLYAESDRKVVKAAIKTGKAQGAKINSLTIKAEEADMWQTKIDDMTDEIDAVLRDEKEERQLATAEMQIRKAENMVVHKDEILSRPKRSWFETQREKQKAKEAGDAHLNGEKLKGRLLQKSKGKLSNKDKKKLDLRTERTSARTWKKGSVERAGKGAVLNLQKKSKAKKVKAKK